MHFLLKKILECFREIVTFDYQKWWRQIRIYEDEITFPFFFFFKLDIYNFEIYSHNYKLTSEITYDLNFKTVRKHVINKWWIIYPKTRTKKILKNNPS